jgi:hypothetical protein
LLNSNMTEVEKVKLYREISHLLPKLPPTHQHQVPLVVSSIKTSSTFSIK